MDEKMVIILLSFLNGLLAEGAETRVAGFVGESVILRSGVAKSGTLLRVEWSIMTNFTYIAQYFSGKPNYPNFWQFQNRLVINGSTGDLEIKNLKMYDSLKYIVRLVDNITGQETHSFILTVYDRPAKPAITMTKSSLQDGVCWVSLKCLVERPKNVTLTWSSPAINCNTTEDLLTAVFSPNQATHFTCTASNGVGTNFHTVSVQCPDVGGSGIYIALTVIFGICLVLTSLLIFCRKAIPGHKD